MYFYKQVFEKSFRHFEILVSIGHFKTFGTVCINDIFSEVSEKFGTYVVNFLSLLKKLSNYIFRKFERISE